MPRRGVGDRLLNAIFSYTNAALYPAYLRRYVRRADIVHSHFGYVGWMYRRLPRRLGARHVVSFYGSDLSKLVQDEPAWRDRYRELFEMADLFLCEGPHSAGRLEALGCPPSKVRVQHLGVETASIPFVAREKKPGELRLVQVATMREKKGHACTVEAFLKALPHCPNMTLTLVGGDPEGRRGELERMVGAAGASDRVTFLDRVDFGSLHKWLSDFHVFIHPSCMAANGDCEGGAPVVLLDAQATGMPAISTRHCDIPGEVADGVSGVLAAEKDVPALAAAIQRFYAMDQNEYRAFSGNAAKHVARAYDAVKCAGDLRRVYADLTGK